MTDLAKMDTQGEQSANPSPTPNFKVHPSCLPYALPLSKLAKLPENRNRSLEVLPIVLNQAGEVLMFEQEDEGKALHLPCGPAKFGTDQTILESVVRVIGEQAGLRAMSIRALVGVYSPAPPSPAEGKGDGQGVGEHNKSRRYAFLATCQSAPTDKPHKFVPIDKIDLNTLETGDKHCLVAARHYMSGKTQSSTRELVGIPPTRLIKPTFHVAGDLKAYLLPLDIFAGLPMNKDRLLSAGGVVIHPDPDRKILLLQRAESEQWDFPASPLASEGNNDLSIIHVGVQAVRKATGLELTNVRGLVGSFERAHKQSGKEEKRYLFLIKPVGSVAEVKLDEGGWKAFKWVKCKQEADGLDMAREVRVILDHVLDALYHKK